MLLDSLSDWPFRDKTQQEYVFNLLLLGNKEIFDLQITFGNVFQFNKLSDGPVPIFISRVCSAVVINTVISSVGFKWSNWYIEHEPSSGSRMISAIRLEDCYDDLKFFLQTFHVWLLFLH